MATTQATPMGHAAQPGLPVQQFMPADAQALIAALPDETSVVRAAPAHEAAPAADDTSAPVRAAVQRLPVELDVMVPVREFRVRNLLALDPGQVIESRWNHGEDVPLSAGDVSLAWAEFEVIDNQLAVRITRLP